MIDTVATAGMPMVATGNNGGSDGAGGGQWIWAIVLIALLGGGFGGNNRNGDGNAEINGRFNALETQIASNASLAETRAVHDMTCRTNENVSREAGLLCRDVLENQYATSIQMKDMQMAQQQCCCETKGAIAQSSFDNQRAQWELSKQMSDCCCSTNLNMERGNNALIGTIHSEAEATRAMIVQDKIEALRDQLQAERLASSQCNQNAQLINALRPSPVPAYVTYAPNQAVFPPYPAVNAANVYGSMGCGGCGGGSF